MLQDPNVERYVADKVEPLQKQIIELQAGMFKLMQAKNLHLQNVTTCVYTVQSKKTMLVHGSFRTYKKAFKYINGDLERCKIIECYLDE